MYYGCPQKVMRIKDGRVVFVPASNASNGKGTKAGQMSIKSKEKIWLMEIKNKDLTKDFIIPPPPIEIGELNFYELIS